LKAITSKTTSRHFFISTLSKFYALLHFSSAKFSFVILAFVLISEGHERSIPGLLKLWVATFGVAKSNFGAAKNDLTDQMYHFARKLEVGL